MCPFCHIPVGISGIAISASEFTSHIRVERPKPHAGALGRVQDRSDVEVEKRGCSPPFLSPPVVGRLAGRAIRFPFSVSCFAYLPSHISPSHTSDRKNTPRLGEHCHRIRDTVRTSREWFARPLFWGWPGRARKASSDFVRAFIPNIPRNSPDTSQPFICLICNGLHDKICCDKTLQHQVSVDGIVIRSLTHLAYQRVR